MYGPILVYSPTSHSHLEYALSCGKFDTALAIESSTTIKKERQVTEKMGQARQGEQFLQDLMYEGGNAIPCLARYNGKTRPKDFLILEVREYLEDILNPTVLGVHEFFNNSGEKYSRPRGILNKIVERHKTSDACFTDMLRRHLNTKPKKRRGKPKRRKKTYNFIVGQLHNRYIAEALSISLQTGFVYILTDFNPSKSESSRLLREEAKKKGEDFEEPPSQSDLDIAVVSTHQDILQALAKMRRKEKGLKIKSYNRKLLLPH